MVKTATIFIVAFFFPLTTGGERKTDLKNVFSSTVPAGCFAHIKSTINAC
jgi:hypothetical protein